jgi:hypothetical protein
LRRREYNLRLLLGHDKATTSDLTSLCNILALGRVDELRRRLAVYYGLDLSALPQAVVKASPLALDEDIQQRQWGYLRDLGNEWAEMTAAGKQFRLCGAAGMFVLRVWMDPRHADSARCSQRPQVPVHCLSVFSRTLRHCCSASANRMSIPVSHSPWRLNLGPQPLPLTPATRPYVRG